MQVSWRHRDTKSQRNGERNGQDHTEMGSKKQSYHGPNGLS